VLDANTNQLATITTSETVSQTNQSMSVTLNSIVASLQVVPPNLAVGSTASAPLTITYYDASGAQIVGGTFANSVTITDGQTPPHSSLQLNGGSAQASVTVTADGDVVVLTYDGTNATIPLSYQPSGGGTGGNVPVSPAQPISFTNTSPGIVSTDPNYGVPTLYFYSTPTLSFTASEPNYSGSFTYALDPTTCYASGNPVVTVTTTDNLTFSVTVKAVALCKITVTGAPNQSAVLWTSVSGVNIITH
jgi:hypothetical protein